MLRVKNSWLSSNVRDRLEDQSVDFNVTLTPQRFEKIDFHGAARMVALEIGENYDNIFIGLSGGIDSEYVMTVFHDLKIPFRPIIVATPGNTLEVEYAYYKCEELKITPIILSVSETEFLSVYKNTILRKVGSKGINYTPNIITSHYVKKNNGFLITADHLLDEGYFATKAELVSISDYDLCLDCFDVDSTCFFIYNPEITYAMIEQMDGSKLTYFKSRLYGLPFRPKIRFDFSDEFYKNWAKIVGEVKFPKKSMEIFGTKNHFLHMMEEWNK